MGKTRIRPTVEFINLKLASTQTGININTEVLFVEESANGLSVVSNRVTLKAGRTYVLSANLRLDGITASSAASFTWRDYTNSVDLGKLARLHSSDNTSDDGQQPGCSIVIKPTTDIDVGVRCTEATNQGLHADASQATIHSI